MTKATEKPTGLALLREPFPSHQISKLPKPYKKDSPKGNCQECGGYHGLPAVHLDYVGHAALTDRLLDADPNWSWEPMTTTPEGLPLFDKIGGLWIRLTVCGVTRLGYGATSNRDGCDGIKEAIGDALRNAAMRFGAALDLWHKGQLHEDESAEDAAEDESLYLDWIAALESVADGGSKALIDAIKAVQSEEWRSRLRRESRTWAALKTRAEKADRELVNA